MIMYRGRSLILILIMTGDFDYQMMKLLTDQQEASRLAQDRLISILAPPSKEEQVKAKTLAEEQPFRDMKEFCALLEVEDDGVEIILDAFKANFIRTAKDVSRLSDDDVKSVIAPIGLRRAVIMGRDDIINYV